MELLIYCLYPFILIFMLLEWICRKTLQFVRWVTDDPEPQRKRIEDITEIKPGATKPQRGNIEPPDQAPPKDDGMNPQERTLPYIMPGPAAKPEPKKEEEKPPIAFHFSKPGQSLKAKRGGKKAQNTKKHVHSITYKAGNHGTQQNAARHNKTQPAVLLPKAKRTEREPQGRGF